MLVILFLMSAKTHPQKWRNFRQILCGCHETSLNICHFNFFLYVWE